MRVSARASKTTAVTFDGRSEDTRSVRAAKLLARPPPETHVEGPLSCPFVVRDRRHQHPPPADDDLPGKQRQVKWKRTCFSRFFGRRRRTDYGRSSARIKGGRAVAAVNARCAAPRRRPRHTDPCAFRTVARAREKQKIINQYGGEPKRKHKHPDLHVQGLSPGRCARFQKQNDVGARVRRFYHCDQLLLL